MHEELLFVHFSVWTDGFLIIVVFEMRCLGLIKNNLSNAFGCSNSCLAVKVIKNKKKGFG